MKVQLLSWKLFVRVLWYFLFLLSSVYVKSDPNVVNPSVPRGFNCNFDEGWCGWSNTFKNESIDNFNWKLGTGQDGRQRGSGTSDDRGNGGGYVFIKSRKWTNRTAKMISPYFNITRDSCFQFWYFMRGKTLGHLEVQLAPSRTQAQRNAETLWNLRGHQGSKWKNAMIPLKSGTNGVLILEGFDWEKGKSGNIVIDDISLTSQVRRCRSIRPLYASPFYTTTSSPSTAEETSSSLNELDPTDTTRVNSKKRATPVAINPTTVISQLDEDFTKTVHTKYKFPKAVKHTDEDDKFFYWNHSSRNMKKPVTKSPIALKTFASSAFTTASVKVTTFLKNPLLGSQQTVNTNKKTVYAIVAVCSVLVVVVVLALVLAVYYKRLKKRHSGSTNDQAVIMSDMNPQNASKGNVDYTKFS